MLFQMNSTVSYLDSCYLHLATSPGVLSFFNVSSVLAGNSILFGPPAFEVALATTGRKSLVWREGRTNHTQIFHTKASPRGFFLDLFDGFAVNNTKPKCFLLEVLAEIYPSCDAVTRSTQESSQCIYIERTQAHLHHPRSNWCNCPEATTISGFSKKNTTHKLNELNTTK